MGEMAEMGEKVDNKFWSGAALLLSFLPAMAIAEWSHYGADAGGNRYVDLNQITPETRNRQIGRPIKYRIGLPLATFEDEIPRLYGRLRLSARLSGSTICQKGS